jgi:hypothetical protein
LFNGYDLRHNNNGCNCWIGGYDSDPFIKSAQNRVRRLNSFALFFCPVFFMLHKLRRAWIPALGKTPGGSHRDASKYGDEYGAKVCSNKLIYRHMEDFRGCF